VEYQSKPRQEYQSRPRQDKNTYLVDNNVPSKQSIPE
jgi:hypothetical protein